MVDIQSATAEIRRGKPRRRKKERKNENKNIVSASAMQGSHNDERINRNITVSLS